MKFLFEMFPIILFFIAFKMKGIYVATSVAIAASVIQMAYSYVKKRKVEIPMIISLIVIIIFGGATLLIHKEIFIKFKPTVLYWIFSAILAAGRYVLNKNFIRLMLQKQIVVPDHLWDRLNLAWIGFFTVMGCANLYVVYNFSTSAWVNFKLFGTLGCMIVFVIIQSFMLAPYLKEPGTDIKE